MVPSSVKFFEYEFDALDILYPQKSNKLPPSSWTRIVISIPYDVEKIIQRLETWLNNKITGKWFLNSYYSLDNNATFALFFENENEAIMFKLMDGENFYREDE